MGGRTNRKRDQNTQELPELTKRSNLRNAQDEEGAEINAKSTEYLVNEIVAKSSTTRGIQNPK